MTTIRPTVLDVSRTIAELDTIGNYNSSSDWEAVRRAASAISWQFSRHLSPRFRRGKVTKRDVSVVLASHGASPFTVDRHAREIAALIRNDFSDGA